FRRRSQTTLPVSAFRHITRSCIDSPEPAVLNRKTRPPITIGAERPPYGAFHSRFSPLGDHLFGSPVSCETPSRAGPRQSGQSLPDGAEAAESAIGVNSRSSHLEIALFIIGSPLRSFQGRIDAPASATIRCNWIHWPLGYRLSVCAYS